MSNIKTLTNYFIVLVVIAGLLRTPAFAQSPTPAGGASESATTQVLKQRIEKVLGVVENLLTKKGAYIGEITRLSEGTITIKSKEIPIIVPIDDSIVILQDNKPLEVNKIEVGNWAIVLGNKSAISIDPEYILVSKTSLQPKAQLVKLGTIKSLTKSQLVIIPRGSQEEQPISIQKTSKFEDVTGEVVKLTDLEPELNILVTAVEGTDGWLLLTARSLAPLNEDQ
ncbi:MAG: hypothetical protein COY81_01450 [Candidatus Pacebacteria bacterium CG_4_10_14_0_8_um_filter_43_12]|nr:MAG: hypothetical protein COU66_02800 [Candidatus Pacebacteria bacterium CG10_big_fil_rev_8_21_14_0_10_44_11]PIY79658.1 MAG: hypothetical protein COY81_01450 [Candidatus Pacebacteria bacterium CG_4_10_14_0_8_um_filter_43_12]